MPSPYVNDSRNERSGHKEGGSKGKQGGHGTGKVKCSSDGSKSSRPDFKPASQVIGQPVVGEHDVPGLGLHKGASAVPKGGVPKGSPSTKNAGGKVQKPKDAVDSGH